MFLKDKLPIHNLTMEPFVGEILLISKFWLTYLKTVFYSFRQKIVISELVQYAELAL